MKAVIVVAAQVNCLGRSALLVDDVELWIVVPNPFDGYRRILVNATGSFQKPFHFRQGIEPSSLHENDSIRNRAVYCKQHIAGKCKCAF